MFQIVLIWNGWSEMFMWEKWDWIFLVQKKKWWWWWRWWIVFVVWLTDERHLRFISCRDHCQRFSPSQIFDTPQAGFEPAQNLSSDFVKWSCAGVINWFKKLLKGCSCSYWICSWFKQILVQAEVKQFYIILLIWYFSHFCILALCVFKKKKTLHSYIQNSVKHKRWSFCAKVFRCLAGFWIRLCLNMQSITSGSGNIQFELMLVIDEQIFTRKSAIKTIS